MFYYYVFMSKNYFLKTFTLYLLMNTSTDADYITFQFSFFVVTFFISCSINSFEKLHSVPEKMKNFDRKRFSGRNPQIVASFLWKLVNGKIANTCVTKSACTTDSSNAFFLLKFGLYLYNCLTILFVVQVKRSKRKRNKNENK